MPVMTPRYLKTHAYEPWDFYLTQLSDCICVFVSEDEGENQIRITCSESSIPRSHVNDKLTTPQKHTLSIDLVLGHTTGHLS